MQTLTSTDFTCIEDKQKCFDASSSGNSWWKDTETRRVIYDKAMKNISPIRLQILCMNVFILNLVKFDMLQNHLIEIWKNVSIPAYPKRYH